MSDKRRRLPRHVDGRIKIGIMPIKNFIKFCPVLLLGIINIARNFTPITLFVTVFIVGAIGSLFCEFQQKETGLDVLKEIIKYEIEGNKHFERSSKNVKESKKIINNIIKK